MNDAFLMTLVMFSARLKIYLHVKEAVPSSRWASDNPGALFLFHQ